MRLARWLGFGLKGSGDDFIRRLLQFASDRRVGSFSLVTVYCKIIGLAALRCGPLLVPTTAAPAIISAHNVSVSKPPPAKTTLAKVFSIFNVLYIFTSLFTEFLDFPFLIIFSYCIQYSSCTLEKQHLTGNRGGGEWGASLEFILEPTQTPGNNIYASSSSLILE